MTSYRRSRVKLEALAAAIDAAAARDPYPRLAELMRTLTMEQSGFQAIGRWHGSIGHRYPMNAADCRAV